MLVLSSATNVVILFTEVRISDDQLKGQQFYSRHRQRREPELEPRTHGCTKGIISKRFGLTYIIKELSKCFQRAVPDSLLFRDWRDQGLQHGILYQPPKGVRNYPIVNWPASMINPTVFVTHEFELIVAKSSSFYAELSDQHSNNGKVLALLFAVETLIRLLDETSRSFILTKKQKNETMITPL